MILDLACGDRSPKRMDTVRVDLRSAGDVRADVRHLPFDSGRFGILYAHDILEHFWRDEHPALLAEWRRVAMTGATLEVKVPDLVSLGQRIADDPESADELVRIVYGGHRWGPGGAWDTHHWGFTEPSLRRALGDAGWSVQAVESDGFGLSARAVAGVIP